MLTEQYKQIARRIPLEAFNEGKLDTIDELLGPDFEDHAYMSVTPGREGIKEMARRLRAAFPDLRYVLEDELVDGDKVIHRVTARGTHRGEFMGLAPTGQRVEWAEIHIVRFADGKIVEHWANMDRLGLMEQLGMTLRSDQPREEPYAYDYFVQGQA